MSNTIMAAACTVTATHKYTYTLGRSLYVPVTSRCNSVPLPITRGPNFLLPREVADGLVRVRNAETGGVAGGGAGLARLEEGGSDGRLVSLPPYDLPLVNGLYHFGGDLSEHLQLRRQIAADQDRGGGEIIEDFLQPSIATLVNEVCSRLDANESEDSAPGFDQVVIAGEGEPTLRMDALLAIARSVRSCRRKNDAERSNKRGQSNKPHRFPVRVITNGLCYGVPNLGYSPYNAERSGVIVPMHRHVILRDMLEAGVSNLSVALNTANRHEYDVLMRPCCRTGGDSGDDDSGSSTLMPGTAHDIVCEFIIEATKLGMDVDITGVSRPEVDMEATERLARLLLSVGPKYKTRRIMRWRRYFG